MDFFSKKRYFYGYIIRIIVKIFRDYYDNMNRAYAIRTRRRFLKFIAEKRNLCGLYCSL